MPQSGVWQDGVRSFKMGSSLQSESLAAQPTGPCQLSASKANSLSFAHRSSKLSMYMHENQKVLAKAAQRRAGATAFSCQLSMSKELHIFNAAKKSSE
eukprot:scaffold114131_cov17-Tisochrysis_lutea.AAC.1